MHADGNGMGARFRDVIKGKALEAAVIDLRLLSLSVAKAGREALGKVVERVQQGIDQGNLLDKGLDFRYKRRDQERAYLPLRPLIYGGDDMSLVCDGRLGLAIAAMYLRQFHKGIASDKLPLHACAGVAIVKSHFPFGRAYRLAEDATREAKHATKDPRLNGETSWIDFHIALSGVDATLDEIRESDYTNRDNQGLLFRPWMVVSEDSEQLRVLDDPKDWKYFERGVLHLQGDDSSLPPDSVVAWPRSKVKQYRDALYSGKQSASNFLSAAKSRGLRLPNIPGAKDGWIGDKTPFFDMLEAVDFYIALENSVPDGNQEGSH